MSVTLIMTWNIKDGLEEEYFEFVIRDWVPKTAKLGLRTVAAWYTDYSKDETVPDIRAEALAESKADMRRILISDEWQVIQDELMAYVENYHHKVVETTGEFKL